MAPNDASVKIPTQKLSLPFNLVGEISSSIGIKYPTNRDHPLHSGHMWLEGKKADDGAEGLWRIHDDLYDFQDFVKSHPGGSMWLEVTKGTDITEAFHAHHISTLPQKFLKNYFVRQATTPRTYPFTFHEDGFYETLKTRIRKRLPSVSLRPVLISEVMTDSLLLGYFTLFLLAVKFESLILSSLAGVCLSVMAVAAHNYFHKKDNFRMYYFDFTLMQSREWRISHVLSHHIYTNTIQDLEVSNLEPFMFYLPCTKHFVVRYLSWIYTPVVFVFLFIGHHIKTIIQMVLSGEKFRFEVFLAYAVPFFVYTITRQPIITCALFFLWTILIGGLHFSIIGVNAAHHHPDIFHDGDAYRSKEDMDWGIFQLDAVMDKKEITGSHFLVLTNFGDHALHHLFPTIDHGLLESLYPIFWETCKDFGVEHRVITNLEMIKGQYKQLAKVDPKKSPPKKSIKPNYNK
ncbi:cytochrome b5-related protein [Aethina tumida]|uniref:cytochrome b5-related protein n=1 Tax=Aethina tumida TaxID=116153 RepID=UPI0021480D56|nr:cytochrome b5-related protein [Aethina tumida]XP_049820834.1 cytochrome b5-related protein [Aethina tumida]